MKVFVSCNQKGGVGKTTFAVHFAKALREKGCRVLAIDLDPQGNLSMVFQKRSCGSLEIFGKAAQLQVEPADAGCGPNEFGIVTADSRLAQAEALSGVGMYTRLQRLLRNPGSPWDCAIIDCPPSLGLYTINALAAADHVVIMSEPALFSVVGLQNLMERINEVKEEGVNPGISVAGIILNKAARTTVTADALGTLSESFPNLAVKTMIPGTVKMEEAIQRGMAIWEYAPETQAAQAFRAAVEEILSRVGGLEMLRGQVAAA